MVNAVLLDGLTDRVRRLLELIAGVVHRNSVSGAAEHIVVVHAVAEYDGVRQRCAVVVTDLPDGGSLIDAVSDDLAVDRARLKQMGKDHIGKTVSEKRLGALHILDVRAGEADFICAVSRVFVVGVNLGVRLQLADHAEHLGVGVLWAGAAHKLIHHGVGVDALGGLDAAGDVESVEHGDDLLHQLLRHDVVVDDLTFRLDMASGAGDNAVKTDIQYILTDERDVASGAEEHLVSAAPCGVDCLLHTRRRRLERNGQRSVDVKKNILSGHGKRTFFR